MKSNKKSEKNIMKAPYMKYIIAAIVVVLIAGGIVLWINIDKTDKDSNQGLIVGDENDDDEYFDLDDEAKPSQGENQNDDNGKGENKEEEKNSGAEDSEESGSGSKQDKLEDGSDGRLY